MASTQKQYHVLARKYRPLNFSYLIGQEALVQTLSNAIKNQKVAHAFVLTGIRGIGKTTTARILAKCLNCIGIDEKGKETVEPCGQCKNCLAITNGHHQDIIEMDAASRTGVDDIREITNSVCYPPALARYKIYIIDEVHMLSKNAFNALLKTLEEPPPYIKFIFATTELNKIPPTILSRCQRFDLKRITNEKLVAHLSIICEKEEIKFEQKALKIIANISEGSVRDSLSLLDQIIAYSAGNITESIIKEVMGITDRTTIIKLLDYIFSGSTREILEIYNQVILSSNDPILIIHELLELCNLIIKVKIIGEKFLEDFLYTEEYKENIKEVADKISISSVSQIWQILLDGINEVKIAPNIITAIEMLLIKLSYISTLPSIEELLEQTASNLVNDNIEKKN